MTNLRDILAAEGLIREAAIAPMLVRTLLTADGWADIVWDQRAKGLFITNGGEQLRHGKGRWAAWKLGDLNEAEEILKTLDSRGMTPEGRKYVWEVRIFRTKKEALNWVTGTSRYGARKVRLKKVRSLWDLSAKAAKDPHYLRLLQLAAENLGYGGAGGQREWDRWLELNAMETGDDGGQMVTDEVNFVLDIVQGEIDKGKLARVGMDWGPAGSPSSQEGPPKYYASYSFHPGLKGFDIKVLHQMEKIFRKHSHQEAFRAGQYDRRAVEKDLEAEGLILASKHWRKIDSIIQKNVKWWRKNLESERAGYGRWAKEAAGMYDWQKLVDQYGERKLNFGRKDKDRVESMMAKATKKFEPLDKEWWNEMKNLAARMARTIKGADKAYRRAMAFENENLHSVASIFYTRVGQLQGL